MNDVAKRIVSKISAIMLIIALVISDLILVGSEAVTYAIDMMQTNSENVEFTAYFLNEKGEKVEKVEKSLGEEQIYLYMDITVKNEGYLSEGTISLKNSNFNIKDNKQGKNIKEIAENEVKIEQINAGSTSRIKLEIEPKQGEKITSDTLNTQTQIILEGKYVNSRNVESKRHLNIEGKAEIEMVWKSSDKTEAELETSLLTNYIHEMQGEQKRVVQILVESKITDNNYPIKNTTITSTVLENTEQTSVQARSTFATNSNINFSEDNYEYNPQNRQMKITLLNEDEKNISWNKNTKDTFVITYILDKDVDIMNKEIEINSQINTYDDKNLAKTKKVIIDQELDGIISTSIENEEEEIYKGKLYTGEEREYITTNKININNINDSDSIAVKINEPKYLSEEEELEANIIYKETKINKEEFLKLFGEEGYITIKGANETIIANINKDTETDENGKIVINYPEGIKNIEVQTSKPLNIGTLNLENTKKILNFGYNRPTIDALTEIKESMSVENTETVSKITLKNTESVADLAMDKDVISTLADSNEITLAAVLRTNNESRDLYKDPSITITFPKEITVLSAQYKSLYKNGLEIANYEVSKNENEEQQITINLKGEQKQYDSTGRTIIYLKLKVKTSKLTPTKTSSINMKYTNQYKNIENSVNKEFKLESQYGLITYNQILNYNDKGESLSTIDSKPIKATIDTNTKEKEINLDTALINNYGEKITNVTLVGTIPSEDNEKSYKAKLNNIQTNNNNAKISYSKVAGIKANDNSWEESSEGAVSYKIEIPSMEAEEVVQIRINSILPKDIPSNKNGNFISETKCDIKGQEKTNTTKIMLSTDMNVLSSTSAEDSKGIVNQAQSGITTEVETLLGDNQLSEGDNIYEGETLRYRITITNNTGKDYSKVKINANQKNGYVWDNVEKEQYNYYYQKMMKSTYYEITESNELELATIDTLKNGQSYTYEYETATYLLNNENIDGKETFGTISIVSEDNTLNETVKTIKNNLSNAELQITMNHYDAISIEKKPGSLLTFGLEAKNTTNKTLNNVEVKLLYSSNLNTELIEGGKIDIPENEKGFYSELEEGASVKNIEINKDGTKLLTLEIEKIEPGETAKITTQPYTANEIYQPTEEVWMIAQMTTGDNNTYISNKITRIIYDSTYDITVTPKVIKEDGTEFDIQKETLNNEENVEFITTITNNEKEELELDITYKVDEKISIEGVSFVNSKGIEEEIQISRNIYITKEKIEPRKSVTLKVKGVINAIETEEIKNTLETYNFYKSKRKSSDLKLKVNTLQKAKEEPDKEIEIKDNRNPVADDDDYYYDDNNNNNNDDDNNDDNNDNNDNEDNNNSNRDDNSNRYDNNQSNNRNNGDNSISEENRYKISGTVWLDKDKDGKRNTSEEKLKDITVKAIGVDTGDVSTTKTVANGSYTFNLEAGRYIITFLYDNELYTATLYKADGASEQENSDAIEDQIEIDEEMVTAGVTDTIDLNSNIENIDMGIYLRSVFDLNIQKYVSRITTKTEASTLVYDQEENTKLAKAEIRAKHLDNSLVVVEYKIKVTNTGDIPGYATSIVDYIPSTLDFNSNMNPDWYISGENLYNTSLANTEIAPGETKELTLILTKTMTESNTGLINNKVGIQESSNELGIKDETDDTGSADIIISVSTGALINYLVSVLTTITILFITIYILIRKYMRERM